MKGRSLKERFFCLRILEAHERKQPRAGENIGSAGFIVPMLELLGIEVAVEGGDGFLGGRFGVVAVAAQQGMKGFRRLQEIRRSGEIHFIG